MKKILALCLFASLTAGAYANNPLVSEKVLRAFHKTFTTAQNISWYESGNSYSVRFSQRDIKYIVYYDSDGIINNSMRFYQPALLPGNIITELKKDHPKKTAFGVTEITDGEDLVYFIKMEDSKYLYTIKINPRGDNEVFEKLRKQQ